MEEKYCRASARGQLHNETVLMREPESKQSRMPEGLFLLASQCGIKISRSLNHDRPARAQHTQIVGDAHFHVQEIVLSLSADP
jgi:hypothetical protein